MMGERDETMRWRDEMKVVEGGGGGGGGGAREG